MTTSLDSFSRTLIGLEFRDDSVVVTCLKNDMSGLKLLSSSVFPLREDDETTAEMKEMISRCVRDKANVFVSIPDKWALIKFIEVPPAKGKDALSQMMQFEIQRHIPYETADVFYDFQVVGKTGSVYSVLLVAVHKERIDFLKDFLEKVSLQPGLITLSPFAVLNAVEFSGRSVGGIKEFLGVSGKTGILGQKGERCVELFVDRDSAHFAALKDGILVYFRSTKVDMSKPVDSLADDIAAGLSGVLDEISMEKFDRMILSGNVPSPRELPDKLGEKLGLSVKVVNPVENVVKGGQDVEDWELVPSVGACYSGLGIGASRINLLPHERDTGTAGAGSLITKISALVLLILIVGVFAGEAFHDKRLLTKIDDQLKENEQEIKVIEALTSSLNRLEHEREFLTRVKKAHIVLDVLSELSNIIPSDTWLTNFEFKQLTDEKEGP
ncbi:MAG TPA: hypothetical protein ENG93_01965, partial [Nitrospirae bacterium]|nr:hypothetical protein [Nitrospirota bacterium]